jgi:hypothetical protein
MLPTTDFFPVVYGTQTLQSKISWTMGESIYIYTLPSLDHFINKEANYL